LSRFFSNYFTNIESTCIGFGVFVLLKNTNVGIYGIYTSNLPKKDLYEVADKEDVKIGNAKIATVLNKEDVIFYDIEITKIDEYASIKNITFKITDDDLINKTGGVVQGMSGSPIIQDNKIIGAVTHVIIDNPKTGYGIFITTMLKEGES